MSESAAPAAIGEVRSAAQVLQDDVMCQSFIQGSSTLAYACVLIRRGQYELAGHVLRHLDGRKAGRYRDIVFYLQCRIDIETGLFGPVKTRLVTRLREQPADSVALSLLQACIQAELKANPLPEVAQVAKAAMAPTPSLASLNPTPEPEFDDSPEGLAQALSESAAFFKLGSMAAALPVEAVTPMEAPSSYSYAPAYAEAQPQEPLQAPPSVPAPSFAPTTSPPSQPQTPVIPTPAMPEVRPPRVTRDISSSALVDMVTFQPVIQDQGTRAFTVWDSYSGDSRKEMREPSLEGIVAELPILLPNALAQAVAGLDAGRTVKTCFAFKSVTVTTLHQGDLNCGLVTGPLNQSLIAIVRTETLFAKRAAQLGQNRQGDRDGSA